MTTPSFGTSGAVFTVCAESTIDGLVGLVYDALIDFPSYDAWNSFVYSVDVPSNVSSAADVYIGMPMTFHSSGLLPILNSTSQEIITHLSPESSPVFNGWRFDPGVVGGLLIQAEHINVLLETDSGTRYVSWETYYGAGSLVVAALKANLQKQFEIQAADLKRRVESNV